MTLREDINEQIAGLSITLNLTQSQLTEAVRDYVEKYGMRATDRFAVDVKTIKGDRPFDQDYTSTTVTGVVL